MVKSSQTKQNESTQTENKKIRVYELAKQYGVSSKEFVEELQGYGIPRQKPHEYAGFGNC